MEWRLGEPHRHCAFSDDGSTVLTATNAGNTNERLLYRIVDWRAQRVVWSSELPTSTTMVRPGSGDVLLEPRVFRPIPGTNGTSQPFTTPIVVHADGSVTTFPTEVRPLDY